MPVNQTITDDFGREFSLQLWTPTRLSVVCYGTATILEGDAAERVATYMRGSEDACEEALRQQIEEELAELEVIIYNEEECQYMSRADFDQWAKDCADEFEHRRQESRQDLFI
jgi:D-alanine-D-alanine ligase-like ATP-grasp enzyme